MKAVLLGFATAVLVAFAASKALEILQEPSRDAYTTTGVRLTQPG